MNLNIKTLFTLLLLISSSLQLLKDTDDLTYKLQNQLNTIQAQIQALTPQRSTIHLKFSRLFQTTFHNRTLQINDTNISIIPALSLPYKENLQYPIMIRQNHNFYTLRGDLLLSGKGKDIVVSTARNQYTFFGELKDGEVFSIKKLKVLNRQIHQQHEIDIWIKSLDMKVDQYFVTGHSSGSQNYILIDKLKGKIVMMNRKGQKINQWVTSTPIKQVQKVYNNVVFLLQKEMFFIHFGRTVNTTHCIMPQNGITYLLTQDSNYQTIYGVNDGHIYVYNLGGHCKPVQSYYIPFNSTLQLASNLIFIASEGTRFFLNMTDGKQHQYNLPVSECEGFSKESIIRKMMSQYIVSRICAVEDKIVISHILLDLEVPSIEYMDLSKFRIPLLLLSFGVIIYVTVKNRKREKALYEQEKLLRTALMGQMNNLQGEQSIQKINYGYLSAQMTRKSIQVTKQKIKQK